MYFMRKPNMWGTISLHLTATGEWRNRAVVLYNLEKTADILTETLNPYKFVIFRVKFGEISSLTIKGG